MINIVITLKSLQKISDRLYIRVCTAKFITILYINKIYYHQCQVQQVPDMQQVPDQQQVPDKWRDACELPTLLNLVQSVIIIYAKYVDKHCISLVSCATSADASSTASSCATSTDIFTSVLLDSSLIIMLTTYIRKL